MTSRIRSARLIGRVDELQVLRGHVEALHSGRGSAVLIEGEAGIGKTALVEEPLLGTSGHRIEILRGRAEELESDRPFGSLIGALDLKPASLDPRRARIADLLMGPVHGGGARGVVSRAPELRFRIIDAIIELLEDMSADTPALLVVEDLQWSDASSLMTIRRMVSLVGQLPLMLILTARPFPRRIHLDRVVEELTRQGGIRVELQPLDGESLSRLAEELLGARPGPSLMKQLRATGGNPLFATELIASLVEEKAIEVRGDRAEAVQESLPPSLRLTILRRLSFLDQEALEILRVAAVLGSSFSVSDLALALGESAIDLTPKLESPLKAGLIQEAEEGFAFRHDLVRDAVYGDLPLALRRVLHHDVARALAGAGASPMRVAPHVVLAAPAGDRQAVDWLRAAARHALERDPLTAVSLLQHARELAPDDQRDVLLAELLVALTWSGRETDAIAVANDLLSREHDPGLDGAIRFTLSHALFFQNRMEEAAEQCELAARSPQLPDAVRAALMGRLAAARLWAGDLGGAEAIAHQAAKDGEEAGSDLAVCLALTNAGWAAFLRGRIEEAIEACGRSADRAARSLDPEPRRALMAHNSLAFLLLESDRIEDAERSLSLGRRLGDDVGRVWDLPIHHYYTGMARYRTGDWAEAANQFEVGLSIAEDVETRLGAVVPHALLTMIAVHRDDLETASTTWAAAERHARSWGKIGVEIYYGASAQAHLLEARGATDEARTVLDSAWAELEAAGIVSGHGLLGPQLVRLALLAEDRGRARSVADAVAGAASLSSVPSLRGAAALCQGLVTEEPETLLAAVAAYAQSPRVADRARCEEEAGKVMHRVGRNEDGTRLLGDALGMYEQLGASRDAARVSAHLRTLGIRRGSRTRHRKARAGWEALTASEERVAAMVAQGLSNRQVAERLFISRHTVESHVSHILAKLGAASRVELAAQWGRRETTEGERQTRLERR